MKFTYIDSIRGIAILMVVFVHTAVIVNNLNPVVDYFAKYCQMGVQLFFVASAFTLSLSVENRAVESQPLLKYWIRRVFRIAPVYYLGILLYSSIFIIQKGEITEVFIKNIITNVFFIHGFYPPAHNSVVPGGWSIGTEMAFYLVFPLLFKIAKKYFSVPNKIAYLLLTSILISQVFVLSAIFFGYDMYNNGFLYFSLFNQLPCFVVGISYYFYLQNSANNNSYKYDIIFLILFSLVSITLWGLKINYLFSIIPVLTSISFVFLIEIFRKVDRLNIKLIGNIGKVSFSMYLFHFLIIGILDSIIPASLKSYGIMSLLMLYSITTFLSYLVAQVSFKFIEQPFIKIAKKINKDIIVM